MVFFSIFAERKKKVDASAYSKIKKTHAFNKSHKDSLVPKTTAVSFAQVQGAVQAQGPLHFRNNTK